jgi:deoxyadenosine/deoxycytidine kinase
MVGTDFKTVFGEGEDGYSKALSLTYMISAEFRKKFVALLNSKHQNEKIRELLTSDVETVDLKHEFNKGERIDLLITINSKHGRLELGIENKKTSGLQTEQLQRYKEQLEVRGKYVIVFLVPKKFLQDEKEKTVDLMNGVFIELNYNELHGVIEELASSDNTLEAKFFSDLHKYLTKIISRKIYQSARRKIDEILRRTNVEGDRDIESDHHHHPNYRMVHRTIGHFDCNYGFRFCNNLYYEAPLLNGEPEVIVYFKEKQNEASRSNQYTDQVKRFYEKFREKLSAEFGCEVDYYPRHSASECRLAIRRSLFNYKGRKLDEVVQWLKSTMDFIEKMQ